MQAIGAIEWQWYANHSGAASVLSAMDFSQRSVPRWSNVSLCLSDVACAWAKVTLLEEHNMGLEARPDPAPTNALF
jgi:hypothetical protein